LRTAAGFLGKLQETGCGVALASLISSPILGHERPCATLRRGHSTTGIFGDIFELIPALTEELEKTKGA